MNIPFDSYETVIGFEFHVQLNTKSKLFSPGPNTFGAQPNTQVDIVDAGLPGVLPSLNQSVVDKAIKLGLALSCNINHQSVFARKHYFYPDLPKGYQISQFDKPICLGGLLTFMVDGQEKKLRITRIHIEEDAGKNTHVDGMNASFVDYNRAGTPLLEVVTEPDLRTPQEAMAAFKALRQIVKFLDVCDGNLQEGSMRADLNISVRKHGDNILGTRTETKNLNSFRYVGQAVAFEARRQILELEAGRKITQETRLWDPNAKESRSMRSKEDAQDYRYFPDPDLPPLCLTDSQITNISHTLPEMPYDKYRRYIQDLNLSEYDAEILTSDINLSNYFESALAIHHNPKTLANWIINEILRSSKDHDEEELGAQVFSSTIKSSSIAELVSMIDNKIISSNIAKKVFAVLESNPNKKPSDIVTENNWQVVSNLDEIEQFVQKIILDNPDEVLKYHAGKTKVFGFLMGQLMRLTKGKLDPTSANNLMLKALESHKNNHNK